MIVFVQPFSIYSPGGGARILRSLLQDAPEPWVSVNAGLTPPAGGGTETYLPQRPSFGRIEQTRFGPAFGVLLPLYQKRFVRRLTALCRRNNATVIHAVAHSMDFWGAFLAAQALQIPFFLSVHDDLLYALRGRPEARQGASVIGRVWQEASGRTVISEEIGREYCRRYGDRPYEVITDSLEAVPCGLLPRPPGSLRLYFMGLFHLSYENNFAALLAALALFRAEHPSRLVSLTCRCGSLPPQLLRPEFPVTVLPFGSEAEVAADMQQADLLYFPLPFGQDYAPFVRYSVSTKMVSYLGSGLPILYHGPPEAAAGRLLVGARAALTTDTLDPGEIARTLAGYAENSDAGQAAAENALELARKSFDAVEIKSRFWDLLRQPDWSLLRQPERVSSETP